MRLYRGSPFVCSYTSRPVSKTGFIATVLKFFGTSPPFTMHQPGLPGIRYSFPVEISSANSFIIALVFLLLGSITSLSIMFSSLSSHSSLIPIVASGYPFSLTQSPTLYNLRTVHKLQKQIWNSPNVATVSMDLSFLTCICHRSSHKANILNFSVYRPVPDPARMWY